MKVFRFALMIAMVPMAALAQNFEEIVTVQPVSETNLEKEREQKDAQQALWQYLQESQVPGIEKARVSIEIDDIDRAILEDPDCEDCLFTKAKPYQQVGVHKALNLSVSFRNESASASARKLMKPVGEFSISPRGEAVWTSSVASPGATALRFNFTDFDLPAGAALFLYNDAGQAHGPYTGQGPGERGEFWSHTVFGDHAWIQVHYFGTDHEEMNSISFKIPTLSHLGDGFELPGLVQDLAKADCSANVDCVLNVNCYTDQSLSTARKAMARLVIEHDGGTGLCSGGLLNDQDRSTATPWLLTANHCISTQSDASSTEFFFQYQSPCGSCSASYSESVLGSTLWAHGPHSTGDFSLLELSKLPSSAGLMGWTNADVRESVGTELNCLSHPRSSPQSYSRHVVQTPFSNIPSKIVVTPIQGATEKGSSGAPYFLDGGTVVGLVSVYAGTGSGSINLCDSSTFTQREGALSYFWKSVEPYLASSSGTYKMHVSDVSVGTQKVFTFHISKATVTVVDELGNGVPNVTVRGTFSHGLGGSFTGVTNGDGQATIAHPQITNSKPNFTFCVTNLTQDYFNTYDSASNTATCASR